MTTCLAATSYCGKDKGTKLYVRALPLATVDNCPVNANDTRSETKPEFHSGDEKWGE